MEPPNGGSGLQDGAVTHHGLERRGIHLKKGMVVVDSLRKALPKGAVHPRRV